MAFVSISEAADKLGVAPRAISDLFFQRRLDRKRCPLVAGRRLIPVDYIGTISEVLKAQQHSRREAARA